VPAATNNPEPLANAISVLGRCSNSARRWSRRGWSAHRKRLGWHLRIARAAGLL